MMPTWSIANDRWTLSVSNVIDAWTDDWYVELGEDLQHRAQRHKKALDRLIWQRSYMFLQQTLALTTGVEPCSVELTRLCLSCGSAEHGKPYLVHSPIQFSLSRAGPWVAVAVSERRVGVDIEARSRLIVGEELLNMMCSKEEREQLNRSAVPSWEECLTIWVRKEALVKACGVGLAGDLRKFNVAGQPSTVRRAEGANWVVENIVSREIDLCIAVAYEAKV